MQERRWKEQLNCNAGNEVEGAVKPVMQERMRKEQLNCNAGKVVEGTVKL